MAIWNPRGPRIMTSFVYLSDVEEGGETTFPLLKDSEGRMLTVTPRKGQAVLWPNTLDDKPNQIDERTRHEAMAVRKGVKYAANAWIHMHDFRGPNAVVCS